MVPFFPVCALAGLLVAGAPPSSAAESDTSVLLVAHSPDGLPMSAVMESVAVELRGSGITTLTPSEAASRLSGPRESLDDARRAIAEAERAYLDLDLDRAGSILRDVVGRLDAAPGPRATELLVLALSREALVQLTRTRTDEAAATLDRLYRLDLGHRPDPTYVSPRFAPAFEDAATRARASEARPTRVTTSPEGAELYVDGRSVGPAPASMPLADGMHRFEARLTGHRTLVEARATADASPEITLRLGGLLDDAARDAAAREALESSVLPSRREKFAVELAGRLGARAAVVVTARRGMPLAVDLYRANQPAASLDRVDAAVGAEAAVTIGAWVERRLRPPVAAPVRTAPVRTASPRAPRWRWMAAGAAVLAVGAGAAYASAESDDEPETRIENRKTVRLGGAQ